MAAAFETVALEPALRPAELAGREWLTPSYLRLRLEGPALAGFNAPGADDHVRLFFGTPGTAAPSEPDGWRELPSREYTPLQASATEGGLEFDFYLHGGGPGATWAATAPLGTPIAVAGPRRSNRPAGEPDAWFLAGDETALPAISRFLRQRRPGTTARVILEVAAGNELVPLPADAGVHVTMLQRGQDSLVEALAVLGERDRPDGEVLAFVAAEAAVVPVARALLLQRWALPAEAVIAKGYWRDEPAGVL